MNNHELEPTQVILVDDEHQVRQSLSQAMELRGYKVTAFDSAETAIAKINRELNGVVITDYNMQGKNGIELLQQISAMDPEIPVIILTGFADVEVAVEAMRSGAYDFLEKPFSMQRLIEKVARATEKRQLRLENRQLKLEVGSSRKASPRLLGSHPKMQELRSTLLRIKDAQADLLVFGETGCGKEMVARFLHNNSLRHNKHLVAINCGAIPESMIESELFGHEAGAFTDAKKRKIGKLEYANGGTLFLDEIESMPMSLQIKLLRVLEERKLERLGSNELLPFDVRIIAATKEDLMAKSQAGEFRLDLYYRLNVVSLSIPPLRQRASDIPLLFEHFVLQACEKFDLAKPAINEHHLLRLAQHNWPGNVRELRNVAECFVLLGEEQAFPDNGTTVSTSELSLFQQMSIFEEQVLRLSLKRYNGRLKLVQQALGLSRKTLYDKMVKHHLDKRMFKDAD